MKQYNKAIISFCMAVAVLSLSVRVSAGVIPKDLPTIEALIALHKAVKKDEDKAMQRVAASFGEQSLITKGAGKFNDVRTTLNTKLDNAHPTWCWQVPFLPRPTRYTSW